MTANTITTQHEGGDVHSIIKSLYALGYKRIAPSATTDTHDREICANSQCNRCGQHGLEYHPFTRSEARWKGEYLSYRPVTKCPACGLEEEF